MADQPSPETAQRLAKWAGKYADPDRALAVLVAALVTSPDLATAMRDAGRFLDDEDGSKPPRAFFREEDHPRQQDGKFGTGSGGGSGKADNSDLDRAKASSSAGIEFDAGAVFAGATDQLVSAVKGLVKAFNAVAVKPMFWPGKIADAMAEEAGLSHDQVARVSKIAAVVDWGTFAAVSVATGGAPALVHAVLPGLSHLAFTIAGSLGLMAAATVKSPTAGPRLAAKGAKAAIEKFLAWRAGDKSAPDKPEQHAGNGAARQYGDDRNICWYDAEPDPAGDNLWRILRVPSFARVTGRSDGEVTEDDLRRYVEIGNKRARVGHWRSHHKGHQLVRDDGRPDLAGDAPLIGFYENYELSDTAWGPVIYLDIWGVEERWIRQYEQGRLPFISLEVDSTEIVSGAAMESRPPHFEFPNIWVRRRKTKGASRMSANEQHAREAHIRQFAKHSNPEMGDDVTQHAADKSDDEADVKQTEEGDEMPEQHGAPDAAPAAEKKPDAPPAPAAAPVETTDQKLDKLIAMLTKMATPAAPVAPVPAAPAMPPAQMGRDGGSPDTTRPLEPASSASRYAKDNAMDPKQYARLHPDDIKRLERVEQYAEQQARAGDLASVTAEVRQGGGTEDEVKLAEAMHAKSPDAARQFAAHIRTRGPLAGGPSALVAVDIPTGAVDEVVKQFGRDPADRQVAVAAAQDWQDTTRDQGDDGRAMRLHFAGPDGCKKFIRLQVDKARRKRAGRAG